MNKIFMRTRILVVGGGPAGSAAARMLSQANLDIVLLEKDLNHKKPCGGGIPSTVFKEMDIPLNIPHRKVDRLNIVFPSNRNLEISLQGGSIIIVERIQFDLMLRALASNSGALILEGLFLDVETKNKRLISRVLINGKVETIESDYIIASDGVNSRVKKTLGISSSGSVYTLSSTMNGRDTDACEFWFGTEHAPNNYSWVFPKINSISVGTGTTDARKARLFFNRFLRRLNDDRLTGDEPRGYKIPLWDDKLYNIGNIIFAGDSAGQVMPFTCEGIYYAMKSGEFAAEAIINNKPYQYKKLWRGRFYSKFRFMRTLRDVFLQDDPRIEKLYSIFSRSDFQEVSMRLWLRKDSGRGSLLSYINIFRKFLY